MLTKSNASMYILTLILSFVLSGYILNLMKIKLKMYNRNYGGFDYVRIHSELLTLVLNRKTLTLIP